jgi:hypothetical protein
MLYPIELRVLSRMKAKPSARKVEFDVATHSPGVSPSPGAASYKCRSWRQVGRALMFGSCCARDGRTPVSKRWRTRRELHPQPSRRQRGALLIQLRVRKKWEVLVMLQFVASDTYFVTPDLQSSSRITPRKLEAGAGVAPAEAELMRLA